MKHAILLLGDEDSSVVKECNKILVTLASYDEGVIILYRSVHSLETTTVSSRSFVRLFVCSFVRLFVRSFVRLFFLFFFPFFPKEQCVIA